MHCTVIIIGVMFTVALVRHLADEYIPCWHCDRLAWQSEEPVCDEYIPTAHKLHELCDAALENESGEHAVQ